MPGWWLSNPGGGGGGTVQTDGVTIQGDGSAGNKIAIKQVETQARLTGAGTVASKLDIAGWPLTQFQRSGQLLNKENLTGANVLALSPFSLSYALTFSNIVVFVGTADAVNNSDIGIYNSGGVLIANIGAQTLPSATEVTLPTVQGSQTILPGLYWFAFTSAGATLAIFCDPNGLSYYFSLGFGASVGGALPASIVPPAFSPGREIICFLLI